MSSLNRVHRPIIGVNRVCMLGASPVHVRPVGHAPNNLVHQILRRHESVEVVRLLRLARGRHLVLGREGHVMIATVANIARNGGRMGAPGGLAVAQIIEGLCAWEEAVQHTVAIMDVDAMLLRWHVLTCIVAHAVPQVGMSKRQVVHVHHHGPAAGDVEAGGLRGLIGQAGREGVQHGGDGSLVTETILGFGDGAHKVEVARRIKDISHIVVGGLVHRPLRLRLALVN